MLHFFIAFLLYQLKPVLSSQILFWDFSSNFVNAGYASSFIFSFSTESGISSSDYLKIVLPITIHDSKSANSVNINTKIVSDLTAYYSSTSSGNCQVSIENPAQIFFDYDAYYVQFLDKMGFPTDLLANTVYNLKITTKADISAQKVGVYDPIELYSVAAVDFQAIIYDSNPAFTSFALTDTPSNSIEAFLSIDDNRLGQLGSNYEASINILSKASIPGKSRFLITLPNNYFTFSGGCSLVDGVMRKVSFKAISEQAYSCTVDTTKNEILVKIYTDVVANEFRISVRTRIQNPNKVVSDVKLTVKSIFAHINHIVAQAQTNEALRTLPILLLSSKINLAWDLKLGMMMAPGQMLTIVRGDASPPTYYVYNSIRFKFRLANSIAEGQKYQLSIYLKTADSGSTGSHALEGSIIENLIEYPGTKVRCYVINNDQAASTIRTIVCDNVGALKSNTEYFVGVRMYFNYDVTVPNLPSDFSKLSIKSKTGTTIDSNYILEPTSLQVNIPTINNQNWYINAMQGNIVTSQYSLTSDIKVYPTDTDAVLGLMSSSTKEQKMVFAINPAFTQITATALSALATTNIPDSAGMFIIMNPIISFNGNIVLENVVKDVTKNQVYMRRSETNLEERVLNVKVSGSTTWAVRDVFNSRFSLKPAIFKTFPSIYADQFISDFYFYSYDKIDLASPTYISTFMANSYAITTPKPTYLYYSLINWYGGASVNNDGGYLPTMIRLAGFLRADDIYGGNKALALFFDNGLKVFKNNTDDASDLSIGCGATTSIACYGFSSTRSLTSNQLYAHYQKVLLEFPNSVPTEAYNSFHVVIPVQTVANIFSINLFLATLSSSNVGNYYFYPQSVFRLTGDSNLLTSSLLLDFTSSVFTSSLTSPYTLSLSNIDYSMDLSSTTVGSTKDKMKIKCSHTEGGFLVQNSKLSSDSKNGAGFTYLASWNFKSDISVVEWQFANSNSKCVFFNFTNNEKKMRFGVFCPLDLKDNTYEMSLKISGFRMPKEEGVKIPDGVAMGYSQNTGVLVSLRTFGGVMTYPAALIVPPVIAIPYLLGYRQKDILIRWYFTTSNPIYNDMRIRMTFVNGINFEIGSVCEFYHRNSSFHKYNKCSFFVGDKYIDFIVGECLECPMKEGDFVIYHYGNNGPSSKTGENIASTLDSIKTILKSGYAMDSVSIPGSSFQIKGDSNGEFRKLLTEPLSFSTLNQNSRTDLKIIFGTNIRELYKNEIISIDLGALADLNSGNKDEIVCHLYNYSYPDKFDFNFGTIDMTRLSDIQIKVKNNILGKIFVRFIFSCSGLLIPNMESIPNEKKFIFVSLKYGSTFLQESVSMALPNFFQNTYSNDVIDKETYALDKRMNTISNLAEIYFNMTLSFSVSKDTRIYIRFPFYYIPNLSGHQDNLYCKLNDMDVSCYTSNERTLLITGYNSVIKPYDRILLKINGVMIPGYSQPKKFFIGFDNDTDPSFLIKYKELDDWWVSKYSSKNFLVYNFSVLASNYLRSSSQYRQDFIISNEIIKENNYLILDFPFEWSLILQKSNPWIELYGEGNNTNFVKSCSTIGIQVKCQINFNDSSVITKIEDKKYFILINGVINPNTYLCKPNKISMSFFETTIDDSFSLNKTSYYSYYNTMNVKKDFSFLPDENTKTLKFLIDSSSNYSSSDSLLIIQNFFSKPVRIQLEGYGLQYFDYPLELQIKKEGLITNPERIFLYPYQTELSFSLGAKSSTSTGRSFVAITKISDYSGYYAEIPFFPISIIQDKVKISTSPNYVKLIGVKGGFSTPITIKIINFMPIDKIEIKLYIEKPISNITFASGWGFQVVSLDRNNFEYSFQLNLLSVFFQMGDKTRVLCEIQGKNESFLNMDGVDVEIVGDYMEPPILKVNAPIISSGPGYTLVDMNCDQEGVVVYMINIQGGNLDRNLEEMKQNAFKRVAYDSNDYYQRQYGFYVNQDSQIAANYTAKIENLMPNKFNYTIFAYCQNLAGTVSNTAELSFSTNSNGGGHNLINFQFERTLNSTELQVLLCFLVIMMKVPSSNIRAQDGSTCLNPTLISTSPTVLPLSSFFSSNLPLYFYPTSSLSDIMTQKISEISNDITYFLYRVRNYKASFLPLLYSVTTPTLTPNSNIVPNFQSEETFEMEVIVGKGDVVLQISGVVLDYRGLIYFGVEEIDSAKQNNVDIPLFFQLQAVKNAGGNSLLSGWVGRANEGEEMRFNFTGLKNNSLYAIYYSCSVDDPWPYGGNSGVRSKVVNTTIFVGEGKRLGGVALMMLVLMYLAWGR